MPRPSNPHPYHKHITRWLLDGRQVPPGTPGAAKVVQETSTYYADVGGQTKSLKTTDLQIAWKRLNDRLKEAHQRELGVRDEYTSHAKTPLRQHLTDWLQVLAAKGTGQKQRDMIETRLDHLFRLARWEKLSQISADGTLLALAALQQEAPPRGTRQGRGAQTRNHYLTHLRGFVAWCVQSDRLRK